MNSLFFLVEESIDPYDKLPFSIQKPLIWKQISSAT